MTGTGQASQREGPAAEKLASILRRKSRSVLALVMAVALLAPVLLLTQYYFSQRTSSVYTPIVDTASRFEIAMRWAQSDLRTARVYDLPGAEDRLASRAVEARDAIAQITLLARKDSAFAPMITKVNAASESWWEYADSVVETSTDPGEEGSPPSPPENVAALADFTALISATDSIHSLASEKRNQLRTWRTTTLVGGSVLAVSMALMVSFALLRDTRRTAALITEPIEELDRVVRADAGGGSGTRARARTDHGPAEVRALATAFNALLDTRDHYVENREEHVRRLEELDRQKDDFLSTVSHELRTPLASIVGYTEMLCDGDAGELTPPQERLVSVVQRNADRLRGMIEDLLILSRVEAKGLDCDHAPMRLDHTVTDVLESLGPVARRADLTVNHNLAEAEIDGDALQLERAVTNLVSNAIKFTPPGGDVTVSLTSDAGAGTATVSIADTGIGVPADEQDLLGTRFFRSTAAQRESIPGTGLGLSIVLAIAESHGGELDFDSVEGQGTTFHLRLPL